MTLQGAPKDSYLLNALKTLFGLSRVLLDQEYISSGTTKYSSVRSSTDNLTFTDDEEIIIILSKILDAILSFMKVRIFPIYSYFHYTFESEKVIFLFQRTID